MMATNRATDIDEAFEHQDPWDVLRALEALVADKYDMPGIPPMKPTEVEMIPMLILLLDGEVSNGGFDQFFTNYSGDRSPEIMKALKTIKAVNTARILQQTFSIFPGDTPPLDRDDRWNYVYEETGDAHSVLRALDEAYYQQSEDVFALAVDYLKDHKTAFL